LGFTERILEEMEGVAVVEEEEEEAAAAVVVAVEE